MDKSRELMEICVKAMDDRLAQDIEVLDVSALTDLGDYFVLATGNSSTQVRAIADAAEEAAEKAGFNLHHREGYRGESWILLDFSDVIVHIFDKETREFYALGHLWEDALAVDITKIIEE